MEPSPKRLQGVAYYDGCLYVTCDDGNADDNAPDHMYRIRTDAKRENGTIELERTFDDVIEQGEIEGLAFDEKRGEFLLLYNRGAKIVAGMPSGFYDGYDKEINEVFVYEMQLIKPSRLPLGLSGKRNSSTSTAASSIYAGVSVHEQQGQAGHIYGTAKSLLAR